MRVNDECFGNSSLCHDIYSSVCCNKEFVCRDISQVFLHDLCLSSVATYFHCCDNVLLPFSLFFATIELKNVTKNMFCLLPIMYRDKHWNVKTFFKLCALSFFVTKVKLVATINNFLP